MSYPPCESSALDHGHGKQDGGWWKNTKDAIKKSWKWKAGNKEQKNRPFYRPTTQQDQWKERPFGAFPPMMSQLTPGGFLQDRRNSNPEEKRAKRFTKDQQRDEDFNLPEYDGQRRPRLDSIFPMHDTPSVAAGKLGEAKKNIGLAVNVGPRPGVTKVAGRSSSFNEADCGEREEREDEEREQECRGKAGDRRESIDSNSSGDRSLDRRKRRIGAVRQLPRLPKRSAGFDWTEVRSLPETAGHRRRRATPAPFGGGVEVSQYHYAQPMSPPRGIPMHNFAYPHWGPPADTLPTLSEESDNDEIKGFDNFRMY